MPWNEWVNEFPSAIEVDPLKNYVLQSAMSVDYDDGELSLALPSLTDEVRDNLCFPEKRWYIVTTTDQVSVSSGE